MALFIIEQPADWNVQRNARGVPHNRCRRMTAPAKDNLFQVSMDVQNFMPDEITVKTVGRQIVVDAKHEEQEDAHGFVFRHFIRKYDLPEECRPEDVSSSLSSDGVLTISAPKHKQMPKEGERIIPITRTGPVQLNVKENQGAKEEKKG